jgi:hypothetical protein
MSQASTLTAEALQSNAGSYGYFPGFRLIS